MLDKDEPLAMVKASYSDMNLSADATKLSLLSLGLLQFEPKINTVKAKEQLKTGPGINLDQFGIKS